MCLTNGTEWGQNILLRLNKRKVKMLLFPQIQNEHAVLIFLYDIRPMVNYLGCRALPPF